MAATSDCLTIFDRINIANCAKQRAIANVRDNDRFHAEYITARRWIKYRCVNTPDFSYVEDF
jgi:hypothetical protein